MEMLQSREYNVIMNPAGENEPADTTKVANSFLFAGAENKQRLMKEFTIMWICHFDMRWYPFDSQTCSMMFTMDKKFGGLVDLNPVKMTYSGPEDLTQYTVKGYRMCLVKIGTKEGVEVSVTLGRPLFSNTLTVFIPTIILLLINHMTKVFEQQYLDMVIQVNLTVLLVLASL